MLTLLALAPHEGHGVWTDTVTHALVDHGALALLVVAGAAVVGFAWSRRRAG